MSYLSTDGTTRCYYVPSGCVKSEYDFARKACKVTGGQLVDIASEYHYGAIKFFIQDWFLHGDCEESTAEFWTGLWIQVIFLSSFKFNYE